MIYDVAVVGGGPAGMMSAIFASRGTGKKVVLIERNKQLGSKLLITGKGRCNITNQEEDIKTYIKKYGEKGSFLHSLFYQFCANDVINFFEENGVETKIERGQRVFPVTDRSRDVLDMLLKLLKDNNVEILNESLVTEIVSSDNKITKLVINNKEEIIANNYVVCTGGLSYPITGSTGDGFDWLKSLGHNVTKLAPALVPIIVKEPVVKELEGLSLKNVDINIFCNNKKKINIFGEALFTNKGLSGPVILTISKEVGKLLAKKDGDIILSIDFKPKLDSVVLDKRIQKDFSLQNKKMFKNSLKELLPAKLIPVIVRLSKIDENKKVCEITKEERKRLLNLLKDFKLTVKRLGSYNKAIITSGGVDLKEIDPKTMRSKIINNLYLAGEIIDIDGPTGGYNLQVCWSSGYVAGISASKNL